MNNLDMMRKRLEWRGGIRQEDRMIKDKWRTFQRTLKYSYQGADVSLVQKSFEPTPINSEIIERCLINPDRLKQDYDDKILSINADAFKYLDHSVGAGDVFRWVGTDSYWLIYLEELTEDSYFRGNIRRCKYKISFKDEDGELYSTYAAIRGPVETQIDSIQKNQIRIDVPNLSLNILMPLNEKTIAAFDRYSEFLFAGKCWQVKAPDPISMKEKLGGVLEIAAGEYYIDRDTDDIENEIKNGLVIEPIDPTPESGIMGETWIKPLLEQEYSVEQEGGLWTVDKCLPVCLSIVDNKTVKVKWTKTTHGQFDLHWQKDDVILTKTIVVESLF